MENWIEFFFSFYRKNQFIGLKKTSAKMQILLFNDHLRKIKIPRKKSVIITEKFQSGKIYCIII